MPAYTCQTQHQLLCFLNHSVKRTSPREESADTCTLPPGASHFPLVHQTSSWCITLPPGASQPEDLGSAKGTGCAYHMHLMLALMILQHCFATTMQTIQIVELQLYGISHSPSTTGSHAVRPAALLTGLPSTSEYTSHLHQSCHICTHEPTQALPSRY